MILFCGGKKRKNRFIIHFRMMFRDISASLSLLSSLQTFIKTLSWSYQSNEKFHSTSSKNSEACKTLYTCNFTLTSWTNSARQIITMLRLTAWQWSLQVNKSPNKPTHTGTNTCLLSSLLLLLSCPPRPPRSPWRRRNSALSTRGRSRGCCWR